MEYAFADKNKVRIFTLFNLALRRVSERFTASFAQPSLVLARSASCVGGSSQQQRNVETQCKQMLEIFEVSLVIAGLLIILNAGFHGFYIIVSHIVPHIYIFVES